MTRIVMIGAMLAVLAVTPPLAVRAHPMEGPRTPETEALEKEVIAFRNDLIDAMATKDIGKLRAMYVDSFSHTHGSGKVDGKDSRIVALLAGDPVIENAPVEDLSIRTFNGDTAIVTGKSPILNKAENRMYDFRWIAVYVKGHGQWHLAASQATRLPVKP
ncbi:MAG TPA: nuclear transport factor 2 family protein [Vineibacter sp.]|nr:nuclear transport factor 2 family protein [Vineibacter sp.]